MGKRVIFIRIHEYQMKAGLLCQGTGTVMAVQAHAVILAALIRDA